MNQQLISINQLSRDEIERLIEAANNFAEGSSPRRTLNSFIVGLLFFEESTRTLIGFQTAAYRLGLQTINLNETKKQQRMSSGESPEDTIRVLAPYLDLVCVRSTDGNIFSKIQPLINKPIINCGNGTDEHPTQALIDLMAIKNLNKHIDDIRIAVVGDLRHMRTSHSLVLALSKFKKIYVRAISPFLLKLPKKYRIAYLESGNKLEETEKLDLRDIDVVYVTGFALKTPIKTFSKKVRHKYQINIKVINQLRQGVTILCPLPRVDEITAEVDETKHAKYFLQSEFGLYMRMAILETMLRSAK